jgi:hypothetical protein
MANLASNLLQFILGLLGDPRAAAEFQEDPQAALSAAGLDDVCPADVRGLIPVLEDYAPVGTGVAGLTHTVAAAPAAASVAPQVVLAQPSLVSPAAVSPAVAAADSDDVVEQLRYIQQTYTYNANTTIDARDSVWAGQDVYQLFGDDSVMAAGGSVAAGEDVEDVTVDHSIEDSYNIDDSFNPENSGNTQIGTGNVNGDDADVDLDNSGNTVDGDGNAVGRGNDVDNSDNSVEVEDSTGVNVGGGNTVGDVADGDGNALGNQVDIRDSGNDNSRDYDESFNRTETDVDLDVDIDRSFNEEETEVDVTTEDILVGDRNVGGDVDEDNDTITTTTTEVPIEFDDINVDLDD